MTRVWLDPACALVSVSGKVCRLFCQFIFPLSFRLAPIFSERPRNDSQKSVFVPYFFFKVHQVFVIEAASLGTSSRASSLPRLPSSFQWSLRLIYFRFQSTIQMCLRSKLMLIGSCCGSAKIWALAANEWSPECPAVAICTFWMHEFHHCSVVPCPG